MSAFERLGDFGRVEEEESQRITIHSILIAVTALGMIVLGLVMRNSAFTATIAFNDEVNGIRAQIPANWLIDQTSEEDYIFRAENTGGRPFQTIIQVSVKIVGPDATPRNVVDLLEVEGPTKLAQFRVLSVEDIMLGDDEANRIIYTYVETEPNPFLEAVPIVVQGMDIVVKRGNQAIILTYRDASVAFDLNQFYFDRFLATVEY